MRGGWEEEEGKRKNRTGKSKGSFDLKNQLQIPVKKNINLKENNLITSSSPSSSYKLGNLASCPHHGHYLKKPERSLKCCYH